MKAAAAAAASAGYKDVTVSPCFGLIYLYQIVHACEWLIVVASYVLVDVSMDISVYGLL